MKIRFKDEKTKKIVISIIFGLIGFGLNFLPIKIYEYQGLSINIIPGLIFPLFIAIVWGWKYGLLSALAGGCQSMWFLWYGDGYGLLYSVPIFFLWIAYHGAMSQNRRTCKERKWYYNDYIAELGFRVVSTAGFFTLFKWLVSINPPFWDNSITVNTVPTQWLIIITVNHIVFSLFFLLIIKLLLRSKHIRNFFGVNTQSNSGHLLIASILIAFLFMAFHSFGMLLFSSNSEPTLIENLYSFNAKNIFIKGVIFAFCFILGLMSEYLYHKTYRQKKVIQRKNEQLEMTNRVLMENEQSKSILLSNIRGMVYRCKHDRNWTMEYISDGCKELTGYEAQSLLYNSELSYNDVISPDYRESVWDVWSKVLEEKTKYSDEYEIVTADGSTKWVYEQGKGIYDTNGEITAIEGIIIDISDRKRKEKEVLYLSKHDVLTGVYNRRWLEKKKKEIDQNLKLPVSVIIADINGLKLINDTLGHDEGDRYIEATAKIFKACCRKNDVIARVGGDEFCIIMPETTLIKAAQRVDDIKRMCSSQNLKMIGDESFLSLSLGYETMTSRNENIDDIIKIAEDHMYRHKILENKSIHSSILTSIKTTMYERSQETEEHSNRMAQLAKMIGEKIGLLQGDFDKLELLAMLHDIGKIGISDDILNKPGKLTQNEWLQMKRHPEIGYRIARSSPELMPISVLILCHHERWDGGGYPQCLAGEEIPLLSRIISVVDSYDAMISERPYKKAMSHEEAMEEIKLCAGKQFDPDIAKVFDEIMQDRAE